MARMDSVSRIFSPLSDVVPFTHRNGLTMLQIQELLRKKLNDLISSQNTMNQHLRTTEDGLQERFTELYNTAAANIDVFETRIETKFSEVSAELDTLFDTLQDGINTQFDTLQTGINTQFTGLQTSFNAAFANLTADNHTDFATLENELTAQIDALVASVTASTGASAQSAANAAMSAATAATQATNAATSAADAATSAAAAITVGDNYVASLFNTVGSATRAAITGALANLGAWFGDDPTAPNATILASGEASFQTIAAKTATIDGVDLLSAMLTLPKGLIGYSQLTSSVANIAAVETAVMEYRAMVPPKRQLDVLLQPFTILSTVAGDVFTVSVRVAYDGAAVGVTSTVLCSDVVSTTAANAPVSFAGLDCKINTGTWSAAREARFLVTVVRTTGAGNGTVQGSASSPVVIEMSDIGLPVQPTTVAIPYSTVWESSAMNQLTMSLSGDNTVGGVTTQGLMGYDNAASVHKHVHALFNANSVSGEVGVSLNSVLGSLTDADILKVEAYVYINSLEGAIPVVGPFRVQPQNTTAAAIPTASSYVEASVTPPGGVWLDITSVFTRSARSLALIGVRTKASYVNAPWYSGYRVVSNAGTTKVALRITYNK